jgi:hypothetical protein
MAAIVAGNSSLQKFGAASDVKFGTPYVDGYVVVESVSGTNSFQTNNTFKNEVGISVGQVITDPKMEVTISGVAQGQVALLGEVKGLPNFIAGVQGGQGGGSGDGATETDLLITSIKMDASNEDFMKFEMTGEAYAEVDVNTKSEVQQAEF